MSPARPAVLLALVALLSSCAREEPPPGTRPDQTPPQPVDVRPEYGARVPGFDGAAVVRFDEPLSNPRNVGRDIVGSPAGRYVVEPGRSGISVRPENGWREDVIYHISLPAGVQDLLRNPTLAPVEWLFSTGGEVPATEVSGRAVDRVSARGARGMRVLFLSGDSIPYSAVSDTGGAFRLPGLPYGDYEAAAFEDQDRDFAYDPEFEPGGTATFAIGEAAPTAELTIMVLPADSTAPVLAEAAALDSLRVRLQFDDPLDPAQDTAGIPITVRDTVSGETIAILELAIGELPAPEVEEDTTAVDAEAIEDGDAVDEAEAEEAAEEPPVQPEIEAEPELEAPPELEPPEAAADTGAVEPFAPPIPEDLDPAPDFVTLRLAAPLAPGTYEVEISGVTNLRELDGGGTASFTYEAPPPEEEAGEDEGADGAEAAEAEDAEDAAEDSVADEEGEP